MGGKRNKVLTENQSQSTCLPLAFMFCPPFFAMTAFVPKGTRAEMLRRGAEKMRAMPQCRFNQAAQRAVLGTVPATTGTRRKPCCRVRLNASPAPGGALRRHLALGRLTRPRQQVPSG